MKRVVLPLALALWWCGMTAETPRAAWMSGRYGTMVHWLYGYYTGKPESVDGPVDRFDLDAFLRDFDETGAAWLVFTIGQNTGAYASPNQQIECRCGPAHCSKRDLAGELAAAIHARGKRFILYLPGDALVPSISKGMGFLKEDPCHHVFQTNWTGVIREWAVRLGKDLDGWWFDGMGNKCYPQGFDAPLWESAARAGNPDCAVAFSCGLLWATDKGIVGITPPVQGSDYLGGEFNLLHDGRIRCDKREIRRTVTWMPETAYVAGTHCLHHALFCIDGFWHCWAPWPSLFSSSSIHDRYPQHFSGIYMRGLREKGEFPDPVFEQNEFEKFVRDFMHVGGAVTVNVGITPNGRLNTKSLAYLRALRSASEMVDLIDPITGAVTALPGDNNIHGLGKTFPGAATPFGLVQLSPDTVTGGDNGSGYSYLHDTIEGFSFTHMSGVGWYGDLGNFQVMPGDEKPVRFSHPDEHAEAGYYRVRLASGVTAELTAAQRSGMIRFTYPASSASVLMIDLARRIGELRRAKRFGRQTFRLAGRNSFEGEIRCDHRDGGWGHGAGKVDYTLHFKGVCSKPLDRYTSTGGDSNLVVRATFPTAANEQVMLHVAFSFDGPPEAPTGFDFDGMRANARDLWRTAISGISVTGGTDKERRIFATALYHAMIDPRAIGDGPGYVRRTVFSGWDVFRSEMPLLTLLRPDVVRDTILSMADVTARGDRDTLPVWDLFGCKSGCMIGNPLIPVIATAVEAGITNFDTRLVYRLAKETSAKRGNASCGYTPGSLSETLEYCYDDWCMARLAERYGTAAEVARFDARAMWYTNCWDESVGWMRSRVKDGGWLPWKGRTVHGQGCVESNPYQQGWFVPHDVEGLVRLMGGRGRFTAELEAFFAGTPADFHWNDFYNHPNEPCHFIPYMFAFSEKPWLVQKWTRRILSGAYGTGVRGLCGNEDCGQMSAWYVLSAIGIHPNCPGDGRWYLTAPLFREIVLRLDPPFYPGRAFTIRAIGEDAPECRIRKAWLNGMPLGRSWVTTREITSGGTLVLDCRFETIQTTTY